MGTKSRQYVGMVDPKHVQHVTCRFTLVDLSALDPDELNDRGDLFREEHGWACHEIAMIYGSVHWSSIPRGVYGYRFDWWTQAGRDEWAAVCKEDAEFEEESE